MANDPVRRCVVCQAILEGERFSRTSFCSQRCRKIDLARWLNEEYRIREEGESDGWPETPSVEGGVHEGK